MSYYLQNNIFSQKYANCVRKYFPEYVNNSNDALLTIAKCLSSNIKIYKNIREDLYGKNPYIGIIKIFDKESNCQIDLNIIKKIGNYCVVEFPFPRSYNRGWGPTIPTLYYFFDLENKLFSAMCYEYAILVKSINDIKSISPGDSNFNIDFNKKYNFFIEFYDGDTDDNKCIICCNDERNYACIPCGHQIFCRNCRKEFLKKSPPNCPQCRKEILMIVKIYK